MGRKKKEEHEKEPNHERWLVSYADFITLLFAVFVTLYAMSFTDKQKVDKVIASINASFGIGKSATLNVIDNSSFSPVPGLIDISKREIVPPRTFQGDEEKKAKKLKMEQEAAKKENGAKTRADEQEFKKIEEKIRKYLQEKGAENQVKTTIDSRGLVISLKDTEFFESGQATVRHASTPLLNDIVSAINKYTNSIRIEGHTDSIPIQTAAFPSNWELSTARATNIVQYLISSHAFSPDKLSAIGYGEYRPIADNKTAEGRQKNRRVDIVLLSQAGEQGEPTVGPRAE
ncbi:MAG: OmpA family protein [Desulfocapsaceae bacterium]|nr:OmpA family protein [Desulfocapsaceae bacterium]